MTTDHEPQGATVDVYKSKRKPDTYLYLPKDALFDELPEALRQQFGTPHLVMSFLLTPERNLARAETATVLSALDTKGFYLQLPPVLDLE